MAVDVFISYADKDLPYLQKLETHLAALKRQNILQTWHAERIRPGEDRKAALVHHLKAAHVILLLISADYLSSDELHSQMKEAVQRARQGTARVIPILVQPCDYQGLEIDGLSMLPNPSKAISQSPDKEAEWLTVINGIKKAIAELESVNIPPDPVPQPGVILGPPQMPAPKSAQSSPFSYRTLAWVTTAIAARVLIPVRWCM